jgi:hypothetical protein
MKRFGIVLIGLALLAGRNPVRAQENEEAGEEYEITAGLGPWLILTTSYTDIQGPGMPCTQARDMARKLVIELRTHYHLPAYTYDFANPEREKERERIQKLREQQRKYLAEYHLPPDTPLHIKTRRFEDQYGVLIGGYKDFDSAAEALKKIKKLDPPDPNRVSLAGMVRSNPNQKVVEKAWLNPFKDAFVVRNPKVKLPPPPPTQNKADPLLKQLNENEEFSVLKCPKRFTLVVAQFRGGTILQQPQEGNILQKMLKFSPEQICMASRGAAALNAHNLAEAMRKSLKVEDTYVLHMRNASLVTVGNYDTPDDPHLKLMQRRLSGWKADPLPILDPPLPMEIPQQ